MISFIRLWVFISVFSCYVLWVGMLVLYVVLKVFSSLFVVVIVIIIMYNRILLVCSVLVCMCRLVMVKNNGSSRVIVNGLMWVISRLCNCILEDIVMFVVNVLNSVWMLSILVISVLFSDSSRMLSS